ncbi:hypothetical protein GUITHDRAFT_47099, partial [Guillardia theta CCMP2712]
ARVPIVLFKHKTTMMNGDLSVCNQASILHKTIFRSILAFDKRIADLLFLVKLWAVQRGLCSSRTGGICTFGLFIMMINFLQTCSPPVLP